MGIEEVTEVMLVAASLAVLLLLLAAVQTYVVWLFTRLFRTPPTRDEAYAPRVAILMPLRGADPQLRETLRRLLTQDYPDYRLHVVVDSEEDPAWPVVKEAVAEFGAVRLALSTIEQRRTTCGLQCSALIEGANQVDEATEIIVIVDGDLMAHSTALRELVAPFQDPAVGLAFGNRWFMPVHSTWGALVRYCWNSAAVIPMYLLGIPWGGCMAIRKSLLQSTGLIEKWSRCMVHDAPIKDAIVAEGYRAQFVPSLMMAIRESCRVSFALDFIKRQLTWTRLYHPNWAAVVAQATITTGLPLVVFGTAIWCFARGDMMAGGLSMVALLVYEIWLIALAAWMELAVRSAFRWKDEPTDWITQLTKIRFPCAMVLTQWVYALAIVLASFKRTVLWRGVTYRISDPWDVAIVDDRPFEQCGDGPTDASL